MEKGATLYVSRPLCPGCERDMAVARRRRGVERARSSRQLFQVQVRRETGRILGTQGPYRAFPRGAGIEIPGREENVVTSERYNYRAERASRVLIRQGQTNGRTVGFTRHDSSDDDRW